MNLNAYRNIYFIGVGGIGMSALARYFKQSGWNVLGYDKTPSPLTKELEKEGIQIHYVDDVSVFEREQLSVEDTLVIYTPAIPEELGELRYVVDKEYAILKRAQVLGEITRISKGLGVAGTHGKTTTSTLLAHILNQSALGCTAFLGGISSNFGSNLLINPEAEYTVIEADEFDRSFLQLDPFASIITSCDPDHLDIYGDSNHFREGFEQYAAKIHADGVCVQRFGLNLPTKAKCITYGIEALNADVYGTNLHVEAGRFYIDINYFGEWITKVELGIPGVHNAENAIACFVLCKELGLDTNTILTGLKTFKGVKRRFEYYIKDESQVYIDDYAHHPTELKALIDSLQLIYPDKKITGVFQPHLFTRTRDFMDGFVEQLSRFDHAIIMPIYPARELPIEGVTSDRILERMTNAQKSLLSADDVLAYFRATDNEVVVTVGAGDIDRIVEPLAKILSEKLG